jgi:hypothetical protein
VTALLAVRFRRGVVGETRRTCHLVPTPDLDVVPEALEALCGQTFPPGSCELLDAFAGMPCMSCVAEARREQMTAVEQ